MPQSIPGSAGKQSLQAQWCLRTWFLHRGSESVSSHSAMRDKIVSHLLLQGATGGLLPGWVLGDLIPSCPCSTGDRGSQPHVGYLGPAVGNPACQSGSCTATVQPVSLKQKVGKRSPFQFAQSGLLLVGTAFLQPPNCPEGGVGLHMDTGIPPLTHTPLE